MSPEIEAVLHEKWPDWHLMEIIGEGANATVYKAKKEDAIGVVYSAIKVLSISKDENIDSCTREIRMMESLRGYTNIVCIEDYLIAETDKQWFILIRMELLTPLDKAEDEFDEARTIQLGIELCDALELCQKKRIVHLDIKPSNIFINAEGKFKLGDFGVSLHSGESIPLDSAGFTPNFMAPELYHALVSESKTHAGVILSSEDKKTIESGYDLYSLGLVLYWLRNNNRSPFLPNRLLSDQDRVEAFKRRIKGEDLPPLKGTNPELSKVILKACSADPDHRFGTPGELRSALQSINGGKESPPDYPPDQPPPFLPYVKILMIVAFFTILLFVGAQSIYSRLFDNWSDWSEWTETQQENYDTSYVQEDSREQQRWWAAQCITCGTNNPYHGSSVKCKECGTILYNDKNLWKSVFAYSDNIGNTQTIYGRESGRYFDGQPYWYNKPVVQYRYRTKNGESINTVSAVQTDAPVGETDLPTEETVNSPTKEPVTQPTEPPAEESNNAQTEEAIQWDFSDGTLYISGSGDMDDYPYPNEPPWSSVQQSVTSIVVEEGVTSIGERAFFDYDELAEISLPSSLKRINTDAFIYCDKLSKLTIPEGVESIGQSIIYRNSCLTEINLPSTLKLIEGSFAGECPKLTKITLANGNTSYCVVNGVLFDSSLKELICHPAGLNDTTYLIPDTVSTIGVYAFAENHKLIEIAIPQSVKTIKACAFTGCSNLRSVYVPDSVVSIEHYAFYGCEKLESIRLSANTSRLYQQVFDGCSNLKMIEIPESVSSITGGSVFGNCSSLEKVIIPPSVLSISAGTFQGSPNVVIYGEANSFAQQFANDNNIDFKAVQFPYDSSQ